MPHTTDAPTAPLPLTPKEPFPLRAVLLAALGPALLGVACALFIAPPMIFSDTAVGFMSWLHFIEGGTWNTILTPDSSNIAQSIEYPVTWWSPGQYVPLGLLHSLGLSIGMGIVILSAISTLLFGTGLAALAYSMGVPKKALPWLVLAACSTHHLLLPFGHFIGGEVAQITVFPWAVFAAWTLRKRTAALILILPSILLLGAFGKHSFAIYALSILAFLWLEALHDPKNKNYKLTRGLWKASCPILCVGILFLIGRRFLIDVSHTPGTQGLISRDFYESFGYSFFGPLLGLSGIDKALGYISYHFFGVVAEEIWIQLGVIVTLLSFIPIALYSWLALKEAPTQRLAGDMALVTGLIFFILLWNGGAISLDSRHYQPVAMLLLLAVASKVTDSNRRLALASRITLFWVLLFGCGTALQRHINMRSPQGGLEHAKSENIMIELPAGVQETLQYLAGIEHTIITLFTPMEVCIINPARHPSTRFLVIHEELEYSEKYERYGRVPRIAFAIRDQPLYAERANIIRESFKNYSPDEWTSHKLDEWLIWQAGDVIPLGEAETERS